MKGKTRGPRSFFNVETLIIVAIACCMLFLNTFTVNKLNELQEAKNDAVFVKDDMQFGDEEEFAEEIIEYLPDTYKMIELYDENLEMLFQIQFNDEYISKDDIISYPAIIEILRNHEEGQTTVNISGTEQDVYFKWLSNSRGEVRLLIVYSAVNNVEGIWVFSLVCYLVMILVFILLILIHTKDYRDRIRQYKGMTKMISDELKS